MSLSTGVLAELYNQEGDADAQPEGPIVQVLSVKKVTSGKGPERYRMILSDGVNFMQAMLAVGLNGLVNCDPPEIDKNTIIKLLTYSCNTVANRRVAIILTTEVIAQGGEGGRIGNPVSVDLPVAGDAGGATSEVAAPSAGMASANKPEYVNTKKAPAKKSNLGPGGPIYPIEGLSPYQNKWTIKARVTSKSDIKHWTNAKGEGKLFSVNLLDDTGEIKATGFNDAVDNLWGLFEEGKVYYITKARVNIAKKQFSNLNNEYEITFENSSEVSLCEDQDGAPQIKYNFVTLADLADVEKDSTVDVLGIVTHAGELGEITAKATQKQIKKRELTIVDKSGFSCRVTLWNKQAENWVDSDEGIFAFKGAKVGDFGGKTLSMGGQSTLSADPDISEAHELRGWYDTDGKTAEFQTFSSAGGAGQSNAPLKRSEFKTLAEVSEDQLQLTDDKAVYFNVRASVSFIKSAALSYPACPTENCAKKMSMESDSWRCEKCNSSHSAPEYRYILSISISDATAGQWLSGFNDAGLAIIGRSANEMEELRDADPDAFEDVIRKSCGKMFNFAVRAKSDTYNDQTRTKFQIMRVTDVNWIDAASSLLEDISLYE